MEKKKLASLAVLTILIVSILAVYQPIVTVSANPGVIWVEAGVNGDGTEASPYGNITYAVQGASANDIIKVKPGTYNTTIGESFPITINVANLTIMSTDGAASAIIDGGGSWGPGVHILNNVTLQGFTIKNIKANETYGIGGVLVEGNNSTFSYNVVENIFNSTTAPAGIGIDVHAKAVQITNNAVHDVGSIGIRVRDNWVAPTGVSNNVLIENNTVYRTSNTGVLVTGYAKAVTIRNNEIYESLEPTPYSLFVHYNSSDVIIENNYIHDSLYSNIVLAGCDNVTISGNNILGAPTWLSPGKNIYILNDYNAWTGDPTLLSTNINITNNNIRNGGYGVRLLYTAATGDPTPMASTTTINYNNITGNTEYGVENTIIGADVNATLNWWGDDTGPGGVGSGNGDFVSSNVDYDPWLGMYTKQITPTLVKGSSSHWFNITVKNTGSIPPIGYINITYPSGFTYKAYSSPAGWYKSTQVDRTLVFKAADGYQLSLSSEVTFRLNLTTPSASGNYSWAVLCQNANNEKGTLPPLLQVQVDSTNPTVVITHPSVTETYYSVGAGNYMWLNLTVTDDVNKLPVVFLNDTRFVLHSSPTVTGTYEFKFCYRNSTAIPDGALAIQINATDYVGNKATVYPEVASTTVDNTYPIITIKVFDDTTAKELPKVLGVYYMGASTTNLRINYTVTPDGFDTTAAYTYVYINTTAIFTGAGVETNNAKNWTYSVTGIDYLVINVTVTDMAKPHNHTSELKQIVQRDIMGPYEVGFTEAEAVYGGLVIRGLYAEDPSGVYYYDITVNGTHLTDIHEEKLVSTTLTDEFTFKRAVWLNLTDYAGKFVNITIKAYDSDNNPSYEIIVYTGVIPEGRSYPIELWPGWNLISSPLVIAPYTEVESFLSTMITGTNYTGIVEIMWEYDPATSVYWYKFIPAFVDEIGYVDDGRGYWIETKTGKHDVLIVQGWSCPAPPDIEPMPPVYYVAELWNMIGHTSVTPGLNAAYLTGVDGDYLQILGWDAENQKWVTVFLPSAWSANLEPGHGYWIYMQVEGHIVPPPYP